MHSVPLGDAPRQQRSILEPDPRHDGARSYRKLARIVLQYYSEYVEPEPYPVTEETESSARSAPALAVSSMDASIPGETTEPPIRAESTVQFDEPVTLTEANAEIAEPSVFTESELRLLEPAEFMPPVENSEALLKASGLTATVEHSDVLREPELAELPPPIENSSVMLQSAVVELPPPTEQSRVPINSEVVEMPPPIANPSVLLQPQTNEIAAGPSSIERAVELVHMEPPVSVPPTNGAHPDETDIEIPPVQDLVNPARDLPRDGVY